MKHRSIRLLVASLALCAVSLSQAQDYPSKPITIIVPFAAGGPSDTVARLTAQTMGNVLKSQMIVENVGGAGGTIGAARLTQAKPDGYTLFIHHIGHATAPALYRKLGYDSIKDFEPIGLVNDGAMAVVARKDFPAANCVRAMLGEQDAPAEEILELSCNLDDCTGEAIGFAMERLLDAGALDVYWTSVGMKKNRPGILLTCMCRPLDREKMVELLFRHTTTLGVRESAFRRYTLSRESKTIQTPDGDIRVKVSTGYGVAREKPEFDDLAKIARKTGKSLSELQKNI